MYRIHTDTHKQICIFVTS